MLSSISAAGWNLRKWTVHNRCLKILKQGPHHSLLKTAETPAAMAVDLNAMLREQQKTKHVTEKHFFLLIVLKELFAADCSILGVYVKRSKIVILV
ncbi:hypothetical protein T11_9431 [Trichinella zimbabwensis]|uniref:Uncharacterized protein n=1 Tax=Trichinella zimbabwensis TaxID=268475 RepID=A0A0V1I7H7_9BILA|nr:hypothetical protein T11_9431 [Trichinella zimbabwensis]